MSQPKNQSESSSTRPGTPLWLMPLKIIAWPFVALSRYFYDHWISYLIGRVLRDEDRVYSIKFIWYGDSVYLHPLVWGSLVLFFVTKSDVFTPGWPLLVWFIMLAVCFLTVMYNFDIIKASVLLVCVVAVFSLAYIANVQWEWNPLRVLAHHIENLEPERDTRLLRRGVVRVRRTDCRGSRVGVVVQPGRDRRVVRVRTSLFAEHVA